jgi:ADP-ribose pyrophosphatase YjhB (NUDIX family)
MTNQTTLGIEKKYPDRLFVPDEFVSWDQMNESYTPPIHPDFATIAERLHEQGIEVADEKALMALAKMSTEQAAEIVGPAIADVRHPLGRTGINGTGIFWKAGRSRTADMAILRNNPATELEIALVFNRGKWRLPGGFIDENDEGDLKNTALREGTEETSINVARLADQAETLIPEQVKPSSSRSVDLGYVTSQVEVVLLPEMEMSFDLAADDDAEAASWFSHDEVVYHRDELGHISSDHFAYMMQAFSWGGTRIER